MRFLRSLLKSFLRSIALHLRSVWLSGTYFWRSIWIALMCRFCRPYICCLVPAAGRLAVLTWFEFARLSTWLSGFRVGDIIVAPRLPTPLVYVYRRFCLSIAYWSGSWSMSVW